MFLSLLTGIGMDAVPQTQKNNNKNKKMMKLKAIHKRRKNHLAVVNL
jgi:hypothetical protein